MDICIHDMRLRPGFCELLEPRPGVGVLRLRDLDLDETADMKLLGTSITTRMRTAGSDAQTKPQASSSSVQIVTGI